MFKFLNSKKGFTMMEILIVVVVLGILVAVAVPVFGAGLKTQRIKDCNNQKTIIKSTVLQAMTGMFDNGRKQERLYVEEVQSDHRSTVPASSGNDKYKNKAAFIVSDATSGNPMGVTLGDIRNGYRSGGVNSDYEDGCRKEHKYLKKQKLATVPLYKYFSNEELPVCPFADLEDDDKSNDYAYYILWDDAEEDVVVICSCPECNED